MEKKFALSYLYMFIVVYTAQTDFYSEGIETRSSLYHRRIEFDGVQFTNSLLWTRDAVSKLQCARMCVDSGTCVSFTFTGPGSETRSCRAHSVIMTSSDTASDSAGTRYYVSANGIAEPSAQSTWSGSPCGDSVDCPVTNSQCISGRCLCTPGYFYSLSSQTCVATCDNLADTFTEYPEKYIQGYDYDNQDIPLDDCLAQCVLSPSYFTCVTVDYDQIASPFCMLSPFTAAEVGADFVDRPAPTYSISHYQRTCL